MKIVNLRLKDIKGTYLLYGDLLLSAGLFDPGVSHGDFLPPPPPTGVSSNSTADLDIIKICINLHHVSKTITQCVYFATISENSLLPGQVVGVW